MNSLTPGVTPLRQRMLDDMRMRKLEPKTQAAYVRAVRKLAEFLRRPPDTASVEDLRRFQLQLIDEGTSAGVRERYAHGLCASSSRLRSGAPTCCRGCS